MILKGLSKQMFYVIMFIILMTECSSANTLSKKSHAFNPKAGKTMILIGQDLDTIAHYTAKTGTTPAGVMFYTSVQRMEGLLTRIDIGAGPQHGSKLLEQYPNATIQIGLYMVDVLQDINTGKLDGNLNILADWLLKAQRPVYLRIGYEFDNPENHYDPYLYKKAFRHIVNLLRSKGVKNTAFVWHSFTAEKKIHTWNDWYPGDDYVDWFGSSIFSTGNIPFAEKFLALARKHHKPSMIAESSPMGMYTVHGKKDWFNHIFRFIETHNIPIFCYINSNWDKLPMYEGQHWGDARIENYSNIKNLWLDQTSKKRYLRSSPDLFKELGYPLMMEKK